jgi:hypothetical protein
MLEKVFQMSESTHCSSGWWENRVGVGIYRQLLMTRLFLFLVVEQLNVSIRVAVSISLFNHTDE